MTKNRLRTELSNSKELLQVSPSKDIIEFEGITNVNFNIAFERELYKNNFFEKKPPQQKIMTQQHSPLPSRLGSSFASRNWVMPNNNINDKMSIRTKSVTWRPTTKQQDSISRFTFKSRHDQ